MKATIFTDGSCWFKSRMGGFGVYIKEEDGKERFFKQGFSNTSSNRMELRAILKALEVSNKYSSITIYSDSEYCVKAINNGRLEKMVERDFEDTKNADLWKQVIDKLVEAKFGFEIIHIKGHQKGLEDPIVFGNNVADELADYRNHDKYIRDQ